jgi:hypothetical protein
MFNDTPQPPTPTDPPYVALGREAVSRMLAIAVLAFIGVWFWRGDVVTAVIVATLLLLLLSGYLHRFTSQVVAPAAAAFTTWLTLRHLHRLSHHTLTDKANPMWIGYHGHGAPVITNLDEMTSTAVWGVNGAGKTTLLHTLLYEMTSAYTPEELHIVIFDHGKDGNDFSPFAHMPHLHGIPIAASDDQALTLLRWLDDEMKRRGDLFRKIPDRYLHNDLHLYHSLRTRLHLEDELPRLPWLVVIIDECQDLTERAIGGLPLLISLAKKGRYVGIKLIVATQYPNVDAIPAGLRSQLWTRFCGSLASPREYHTVAEIGKEFTDGVTLGRGQFFARLNGYPTWIIMNGIKIPTPELEAYAADISHGCPAPTWQEPTGYYHHTGRTATALAAINDNNSDNATNSRLIVWADIPGRAAKETAFMEFLRQYTTRPSAADVLTYFQMTEKTAYANLNRYWPQRERELHL